MEMSFDRNQLVGVVAQELGIHIREDDPIFACVFLNRWALNSILDEGMQRVKPAFADHENEISEVLKRSLIEFSAQEVKMLAAYEKMSKITRVVAIFLGVFVAAVLAFAISVALVVNSSPRLSDIDQRHLQLGRSVAANWNSIDSKSREAINKNKNYLGHAP